jgi:hypothetical protein
LSGLGRALGFPGLTIGFCPGKGSGQSGPFFFKLDLEGIWRPGRCLRRRGADLKARLGCKPWALEHRLGGGQLKLGPGEKTVWVPGGEGLGIAMEQRRHALGLRAPRGARPLVGQAP